MATKKKTRASSKNDPATQRSPAYESAKHDYLSALEMLHKGDVANALERFRAIEAANSDEPEFAERMRTFAVICARKLADAPEPPSDVDGFYYAAVVLANDRELDQALELLNKALELDAESPKVMYARASVFALKGQPDSAVSDLRRAVEREPQLRFHASNDPDFERIRDEAAFIDVIEPTPAGA